MVVESNNINIIKNKDPVDILKEFGPLKRAEIRKFIENSYEPLEFPTFKLNGVKYHYFFPDESEIVLSGRQYLALKRVKRAFEQEPTIFQDEKKIGDILPNLDELVNERYDFVKYLNILRETYDKLWDRITCTKQVVLDELEIMNKNDEFPHSKDLVRQIRMSEQNNLMFFVSRATIQLILDLLLESGEISYRKIGLVKYYAVVNHSGILNEKRIDELTASISRIKALYARKRRKKHFFTSLDKKINKINQFASEETSYTNEPVSEEEKVIIRELAVVLYDRYEKDAKSRYAFEYMIETLIIIILTITRRNDAIKRDFGIKMALKTYQFVHDTLKPEIQELKQKIGVGEFVPISEIRNNIRTALSKLGISNEQHGYEEIVEFIENLIQYLMQKTTFKRAFPSSVFKVLTELAQQQLFMFNVKQVDVKQATGISDVTIRTGLKDIEKYVPKASFEKKITNLSHQIHTTLLNST